MSRVASRDLRDSIQATAVAYYARCPNTVLGCVSSTVLVVLVPGKGTNLWSPDISIQKIVWAKLLIH